MCNGVDIHNNNTNNHNTYEWKAKPIIIRSPYTMAFDRNVGSTINRVGLDTLLSDEHVALDEFVSRLNSYNCTTEPGVVDVDEGNTREDAHLLMSLLSSPITDNYSKSGICYASVSSSSRSDISYSSESSKALRIGRNSFKFTCPSLSLERQIRDPSKFPKISDTHDNRIPHALLLGRPLKIEDLDALRLSSDAMARNVLKSFQESIDSRIEAWIQILSKQLVHFEQEMRKAGASPEDTKMLLNSSEAKLILKLRQAAKSISVISVRTSFSVLPAKLDVELDSAPHGPDAKKQRVANRSMREMKASLEEQDDYQYTVSYCLKFQCTVNLDTPVGFSEISLDVPGMIEGTFYSSNEESARICSVLIDIDTKMLAVMMEKSCRTLLRTSVARIIEEESQIISEGQVLTSALNDAAKFARSPVPESSSAPTTDPHSLLSRKEIRPVFVTPKATLVHSEEEYIRPTSSSVLMPFPDDLIDSNTGNDKPRRISPQPSPEMFSGRLLPREKPYNPCLHPIQPRISRPSPSPPLFQSLEKNSLAMATTSSSYGLPLISPTANDGAYREVLMDDGPFLPTFQSSSGNGKSLPMLVEAACRAMKCD